ncbi:MAG: hypothetical protein KGL53_15545, partial [Elusimicrobia bacterium]|nr:hypothetical protein [Elusimicrobiota bacterium]
ARAARVFNPGAAYPGGEGTTAAGEHNNAAKKDRALRAASEGLLAAARTAGATPAELDVLQPEPGTPGEGWVKQFIRHAKEQATKAGVETPVSVSYEAKGGAFRVKVHGAYAMTDAEKEALGVHFAGQPPKDLKAAQQQADQVNLSGAVIRDHNLLDIYRRLSAFPGARFGYHTGAQGTDYWLELPLAARGSLPVAGPGAAPAPDAGPSEAPLTPHEARERANTKALFLKVLLSEASKDNPNVRVAAATSWAMLATREDLPTVRRWIVQNGWADRDSTGNRLTDTWPQLMAAALVLKRYGTAADAPVLERILKLYTSTNHFHIPAKTALIEATGAVLARAGRERARAVYDAAKEAGYNQVQLKEAAQLALAEVGTREDVDAVSDADMKEVNPDAVIGLLERTEPARLHAFFESHWPPQPGADGKLASSPFKGWDAKQKILILKLVGRGYGRPER